MDSSKEIYKRELIPLQRAKVWGIFKTWCNMKVWWEGNYLQFPHSIIDKCPFGPDTLLILEHSQKESKESKLSEFLRWCRYCWNGWAHFVGLLFAVACLTDLSFSTTSLLFTALPLPRWQFFTLQLMTFGILFQ